MNIRNKIALAILAKKLLDDTENEFVKIEAYLMTLPEPQQVLFGYVFTTKLLSGYEDKYRKEILKQLQEVNWEVICGKEKRDKKDTSK